MHNAHSVPAPAGCRRTGPETSIPSPSAQAAAGQAAFAHAAHGQVTYAQAASRRPAPADVRG
ncbi:hypothetical protein E0504_27140 [Parafrankia sp. BMG5.11]|uniref:hypothetical protein n=1 Tax=Parafrankia sp. Ea1.12 TaxID=573499 RepID=UPI0010E9C568|nr:hypothetical protein [Parafrankia sp. Ea1.12]TCJ35692.1 hypothetical protein E0504_27140 [Parafrankia sp. BMG5.11]